MLPVVIATEPYHQIQDTTKVIGAWKMGIPTAYLDLHSGMAAGAQVAVDQERVASFVTKQVALNGLVIAGPPALGALGARVEAWSLARAESAAMQQVAAREALASLSPAARPALTNDALLRLNRYQSPVYVAPLPGATPAQVAQTQSYAAGANEALLARALSPTGRVSTSGALRLDANAAAAAERARALAAGTPYGPQAAGHVPDTTWMGVPRPYSWQPLDPRVNSSIGGQAGNYPVGYQPTWFEFVSGSPW